MGFDVGSLLGIGIGVASGADRDFDRATRRLPQQLRRGAQIVDAFENADERREVVNNRWDTQVYRSREQLERARARYESQLEGRDADRDEDRGRGDFASGRGGQGPRGFAGGQPRGDERDGRGRSTGDADRADDPRLGATVSFVAAMEDAANSYGPARTAALQRARAVLEDPNSGLKNADGSISFPNVVVPNPNGEAVVFGMMDGRDYRHYPNADAALAQLAEAMRVNNIGIITREDLARVSTPAGGVVPVGTGTPAPGTGTQAPGTGTPAPDAPASSFTLPAASGAAAHIYTSNRAGRTMNAADAPKISANQVKAIQQKLGVEDDEKWGPETQAAFAQRLQAMTPPVNPRDVDFTNPNDPETVRVMAQFSQPAATAAAQGAGAPAPAAAPGQASPAATAATTTVAADAQLAAAVGILQAAAGTDKQVLATDISSHQQNAQLWQRIGQTFDLNHNGRVEETELTQIVAAAAAKPEAERVTVAGGAAALNPLFASATFAQAQPAAESVAAAPQAQAQDRTAQVATQTGEVSPPAAAPASAPLKTENAVYVVPQEQIFEPSSQGVPDVRTPGQRGGLTVA